MAKKAAKDTMACSPEVDRQWQARNDADTLRRAGEIMGDRGRVRAAQMELKRDLAAVSRVTGRAKGLGFAKKAR